MSDLHGAIVRPDLKELDKSLQAGQQEHVHLNFAAILRLAAGMGNSDVVELLLASKMPGAHESYVSSLEEAVMRRQQRVTDRLTAAILEVGPPCRFSQGALDLAAEFGSAEVVAHILLVNGPGMSCDHALRAAAYFRHCEATEILLDHCDIENIYKSASKEERPTLQEAIERRRSKLEKEEIKRSTAPSGNSLIFKNRL